MISPCRRLLPALALALVALTSPAAGQTSDTTVFQRRLKAGDTVVILGLNGALTRGRVDGVTDAAISIQAMRQGSVPNEYRLAAAVSSVAFDQIAELHRLEGPDARPNVLYRRRDSFGTLHERLPPGEIVRVVEGSGRETVGRVTDVSPTALAIVIRIDNPRDGSGGPRHEWNGTQTFAPSLVERIEKPAPIWDGAVKGAAIAALATFLVVRSSCPDCSGQAAGYAMTAGIGAGIGLGIDALIGPRRIYRAPRP